MRNLATSVVAMLLSSCAAPGGDREVQPLYFSGRVVDQQTLLPIEGAFVIASYAERVPGGDVNATRCVKTLGMHTASDGEYRFPVDRPDNLSPMAISAIRFGYRSGGARRIDATRGELLLVRQDRGRPVFQYGQGGEAFCVEAATTAAAAAGMRFLEIQRDEMVEYGADNTQVRGIEVMLRLLRNIDARTPG